MKEIKFDEIKSIPSGKKEIFHSYGNSDIQTFLEFYNLRYQRYRERFIVESRFLWQMYQEKQSKIRILLVRMEDGDLVYTYVKNVTIYPAIYLILMGKPLSKSSNVENEEKVLLELCRYGHVKGFEGIKEEVESVSSKLFDFDKPHFEEYYIGTCDRFNNYLNKGSWRSKYSINKVIANMDFKFREFQTQDYQQNKELVELWKSTSHQGKVKFETKSYLDIIEYVMNNENQDRYLIYNLFYKERLIGCIMFIVIRELGISYQEHNINLSRYLQNDCELDNGIKGNIGNIMFYLTTRDLINKGIEYSYCQGIRFWNRKKSGEYKIRLNDRMIEFWKVVYKKSAEY